MWWSRNTLKHLPTSTGPFLPGCMDVILGYDKSSLFFRLFYPTNAKINKTDNSKHWLPWLPGQNYLIGISKVLVLHLNIIRFLIWVYGNYLVPVLYGEKPRTDDKLKCIVMSHGLGGNRFLYSNVCYELASNGFLIISLEHRDLSACYTYYYASKEDAKNDNKTSLNFNHIPFGNNHYEQRNQQIKDRAQECTQIVDFLTKLNNGDVPHNVLVDVPLNKDVTFDLKDLVGKIDLDTLTMMGHSFGGATALYVISQMKRFKQCILLDPWMFPLKNENLPEKVEQPIIFINTQTFHIQSNVNAMSKYLTNDTRQMYNILHTTHEHQTDSALMIGSWLNLFMKKLNPSTALRINNALILTFLNKYIFLPADVQEYQQYLEDQKTDIYTGLTKPWA